MPIEKPLHVLRVLAIGDVVGKPGRRILSKALPLLKATYHCDIAVVNVENAAGGFGITHDTYREFKEMPIDCMTSGNHIFDKRGYEDWLPHTSLLIRPINFPPHALGCGFRTFQTEQGFRYAVVNAIGRVFMKSYDCPFRAMDLVLDHLEAEGIRMVLVDFHAEATSEKLAMAWYLAERVTAIWGTHTHVPTADARILKDFTGYISDLGMTGAYDSVIGMKKESIIQGFLTLEKADFEVAKNDLRVGGCFFDVDMVSGACLALEGFLLSAQDIEQIQAPKTNRAAP